MKPLIIKTSIALAGVSGLGIVAHQSYKALTNEGEPVEIVQDDRKSTKVRDKLNEEGYELLGSKSTTEQHWTEILDNYTKLTRAQESLKFKDFTGNEQDKKEKLQALCNGAFDSKDVGNYEKIKRWCVIPVDVSKLLEKRNFNILNTENSDSVTNKAWEDKIKAYKNSDVEDLKIEGLDLTNNKNQAEKQDHTNIKKKCNEIKIKKNYEDSFESYLKKFGTWCANKN